MIEKALGSENAYVRYLAAGDSRLKMDEHKARRLKERVENDPDPMVRYAPLERNWHFGPEFDEPEAFFALPHEARLAKVRKLTGGGEVVAKLISYAVEHPLKNGKLSELELWEILSDYLTKPEFKGRYVEDRLSYDGFGEYLAGKNIEALWELVSKVPENISHELIEHLPESAGLSSGIPEHVLDGMTNSQLETLFGRRDIELIELRKRKFFQIVEEDQDDKDVVNYLRHYAIQYNFDLTNEEFSEILAKPDEQRYRDLKNFASVAQDLRLCLYEAIHDALVVSEVGSMGSNFEYADDAKRTFERKLENLKGWRRDQELKELRLYRLAVQAVPWEKEKKGYPPSDELGFFLEEAVVEGDTWATFAAFSKSWEEAHYLTNRLEKCLPRIREAGEEENFKLDEDDVDDADQLADRVANKRSDLATVAQEKTLEAVISSKAELADLRRAHDRQRIFTWIVIGLLVTLLFMKW